MDIKKITLNDHMFFKEDKCVLCQAFIQSMNTTLGLKPIYNYGFLSISGGHLLVLIMV